MAVETVTIDPQGDLRLVCKRTGSSQSVSYLVSSTVLRLASKVFKAMLNGSFAEAHALRNTSGSPVDIQLPDDDAEGMRLMLEFLHFCKRPAKLSTEQLIKLARVVHKYACAGVFQAQATSWMSSNIAGGGLRGDFVEYLGMSVAFQSKDVFWDVCFGLALAFDWEWYPGTEEIADLIKASRLGELVADGVSEMIDDTAAHMTRRFNEYLGEIIEPLTSKEQRAAASVKHSDTSFCRHDEVLVADYYRWLRVKQAYPIHACFSPLHKVKNFSAAIDQLEKTPTLGGQQPDCTACDLLYMLRMALRDGLSTMVSGVQPACLRLLFGPRAVAEQEPGTKNCGACDRSDSWDAKDALRRVFGIDVKDGYKNSDVNRRVRELQPDRLVN